MSGLDDGFWAHTPNAAGVWDSLAAHLTRTAERARDFARVISPLAADLAYWAGLWHDLGKCNPLFQEYLRAQHAGQPFPIQPHAIWGAALAYDVVYRRAGDPEGWKEVALPIAGHHSGLDDGGTLAQEIEQFLKARPEALVHMKELLKTLPIPPGSRPAHQPPTRRELFIRMLFSALLDADRLDTEEHFEPQRAGLRRAWPTLEDLRSRLEAALRARIAAAEPTLVNRVRREVYESCLAAASGPPGVYRLTVPTGGGKTLSGLAFALGHASRNGLHRVVVAIPYTSIIDQTAAAYREALGDDALLEHHSQVDVAEDESEDPRLLSARLAAETWDAPLVVTTTVQLFESLLGNHPSRVRKIHNLARSVIVLDEVQTLPPELLEPTLDVLRSLVEEYGVTVVLSTATQPALEDTPYLKAFQGLPIREIVPDHPRHFAELRRVEYEVAPAPLSWDQVADGVRASTQIMVVLNRRRDALDLLRRLKDDDDTFHLSTLLCGAHRRRILENVRDRLKSRGSRPVRLIATQVVEAGVDLDFPVVWRAIGPLDRIVQAAGRCNREGRLPQPGRVVIFEPAEGGSPSGPYRAGLIEARELLRQHSLQDLHKPDLYRTYFRKLAAVVRPDEKGIQAKRAALQYPKVARDYRLIQQDTVPVVVPYAEGDSRLADWLRAPSRATWQRLQPYLVNVYRREIAELREAGLEQVTDGLYRWTGYYDERTGIPAGLDPADLVV